MKIGYLKAGTIIASVVLLLGTFGTASAKDTWTELGQKTIKATDPSTEIAAEAGKTWRRTSRGRRSRSRALTCRSRTSSSTGRAARTRLSRTSES